jgi:crotonobetainyl-CoA:carnitine CoA-transferase CaiB-like acyl-CoA transferase
VHIPFPVFEDHTRKRKETQVPPAPVNDRNAKTSAVRPGPLAGTVVLDLIDGPGAYGPKVMTGLGATVIRVESPAGSPQRTFAPLYRTAGSEEPGASLYFLHYNSGKKSLTLDYRTERGLEVLRKLLTTADVVFDNGQLDRLGLEPGTLAESSPIVIVSVTPFGLHSTRSAWLGDDLVCQAMSGMISLHGYRDERPARFGPEQVSEMSGLAGALGALIALYGSRRHGQGNVVDIAMERVGCLVTLQMSNASMYHQFGFRHLRDARRPGLSDILMQARDGYVQLRFWQDADATLRLLVDQGVAGDLPQLREQMSGGEFSRHPDFRSAVTAFVASRSRAELMNIAPRYSVHGLPVQDVDDLLGDPFLEGRAFFAEVELPEAARSFLDIGPTIRFDRSPWQVGHRPPLLGEHNDEIYSGLGLRAEELAALRSAGVI